MTVLSRHLLESLPINKYVVETCKNKLAVTNYSHAQYASIPKILEGADCLLKAQTGSGKTLAYLLPVITKILENHPNIKRTDGIFALIMTPTRELTQQVFEVLTVLTTSMIGFVPTIVVGGDSKKKEKARIRKGCNLLVGTPGRLLDHIKSTQNLKLDKVEFLILDEADRVLDAGFEESVLQIIERLNKERQTILVSATLSDNVQKLASIALNNHVFIDGDARENAKDRKKAKMDEKFGKKEDKEEPKKIKENVEEPEQVEKIEKTEKPIEKQSEKQVEKPAKLDKKAKMEKIKNKNADIAEEQTLTLPSSLKQYYITVKDKNRLVYLIATLRTLLGKSSQCKVIVFFSCIPSVNYHYALFSELKFLNDTTLFQDTNLFRLHGDLTSVERSDGLKSFVKSDKGILLTTDVIARGVDLKGVDWILQYDPPGETSEYIHRSGRTARFGREGNALLFLLESEVEYIEMLRKAGVKIDEMKSETVEKALSYSGGKKAMISRVHEMQLKIEQALVEHKELKELAVKSYQAHLRSYMTHRSELRSVFNIKKLHIGHICKSFGIRDTPTNVMNVLRKNEGFLEKEKNSRFQVKKEGMRKMSEFDSGLPSKRRPQKK
ncbi:DEAD box ATP-dependent RNA helicase, putative [Entamoeba invadens IP1]|uniref:DEAD box ATP-dependent RNA helicase, putative n=1 Tax=Entamoeba invadens IP1 TaxID=370355 RepID=UPI0002C3EC2B|nr:DEAD box ATP-dependent RNA helicase, putative [Entamoeba invadens IP1]ELP93558.1 DEAD box ATP-dependent RNA helicase, putative [Entamoeba invadens IP1]|eukprot:XP_004260329.1 DEAD box ATP-dependent RNA helicase, putative [Entamoeba invadens IP1]